MAWGKRIYLRPRINCIHMHSCLFFLFPLDSAPFWIAGPDTPHAIPAISPRFPGSRGHFPIELLFLLKIKKLTAGQTQGIDQFFLLGGVHPRPFYPFLISTATSLPLPFFFFLQVQVQVQTRPPQLHRVVPSLACLHPHDVLNLLCVCVSPCLCLPVRLGSIRGC